MVKIAVTFTCDGCGKTETLESDSKILAFSLFPKGWGVVARGRGIEHTCTVECYDKLKGNSDAKG